MKYRREIDGLRAIAVLAVIFFHTGVSQFSGGYVGVDIFFVISGYLIMSIILVEKESGKFSLINFYERRVRRILPCLYFVTAVCIPFALIWMQPNDMRNFSDSLMVVPVFASNILFWRDQLGYSPAAAQLKPLLHTWSLAVEEQYYLLFPIFILTIWRYCRSWMIGVLVVTAGFSFAAAQWGAYNKPVANFLLLPTRAWEFAIGAIIALYLWKHKKKIIISDGANQVLSIAGLFFIFYAICVYDKNTPFPSLYALIPTIGAALIILFATSRTIVGSFLGTKPLVGIGVISYSAYLWHQPLFAFSRHIIFSSEPSQALLIILSLFTLLLAYFTWRFVEQPFRNKELTSKKTMLLLASSFSVGFIIIGAFGHISNGFIGRYTYQEQELLLSTEPSNVNGIMYAHGLNKCFLLQGTIADLFDEKCLSSKSINPRVVIFGDSHAAHLSSGIRYRFERSGYRVDQWTMPGCSTFFLRASKDVPCRKLFDEFISKVIPTLTSSDIIVISANWSLAPTIISDSAFTTALKDAFERLQVTSAKIIVVGPTPSFTKAPQAITVRLNISLQKTIYLEEVNQLEHLNSLIEDAANEASIQYFSPIKIMCKRENTNMCLVKNEGFFLYLDHGHLSKYGSIYLISNMGEIIFSSKKNNSSKKIY